MPNLKCLPKVRHKTFGVHFNCTLEEVRFVNVPSFRAYSYIYLTLIDILHNGIVAMAIES